MAGHYLQLCKEQIEGEGPVNQTSRIVKVMIPYQHEAGVTGSVGTQDELRVRLITFNRPNSLGTSIKDSGHKIMILVALAVVIGDHAGSGDVRKNDRLAQEISATNIYLQHVNARVNGSDLPGLNARDFHHEGASAVAAGFAAPRVHVRRRGDRGRSRIS